jgi:hypothetical protein
MRSASVRRLVSRPSYICWDRFWGQSGLFLKRLIYEYDNLRKRGTKINYVIENIIVLNDHDFHMSVIRLYRKQMSVRGLQ